MKLYDIIAKIAEKENLIGKEYYIHQLFKRLSNEPAPIYTYTYCERIQISHPYISFVFLDTDSKPIAKNIQLSQLYSYIPIHHIKLNQREPHILHEGSLYPKAQREKPAFRSFMLDAQSSVIEKALPTAQRPVSLASKVDPNAQREKPAFRSFTLDAQTSVIDKALPTAEQPVSLAAKVDPNAQREKPAFRSFTLDAQTSVIDKSIPSAEQPISLAFTLDPNDQREKPVIRSFTLDAQTSVIDESIPSAEQHVSLDAIRNFNIQDKEVSANSCILENRFGQCIHKTTSEEQKCDSYNYSLITEPCCYDHRIFRHENSCRILRFHRYSRINHGTYIKTKPAT
jgi:hypothetical protein